MIRPPMNAEERRLQPGGFEAERGDQQQRAGAEESGGLVQRAQPGPPPAARTPAGSGD